MPKALVSLDDAFNAIRVLQARISYYDTSNQDYNQRQIKNAHPSIDDYDYVVRKELKGLGETINSNIAPIMAPSVGNNIFTCRAILPGLQAVTTDILANRYRLTLQDTSKKVKWVRCSATAKIGPTAGDFTADVLLSTDESVTFNSIFATSKISVASGQTEGEQDTFAIPFMLNNQELRVDVTVVDGVASGLEIVLLGILVAA